MKVVVVISLSGSWDFAVYLRVSLLSVFNSSSSEKSGEMTNFRYFAARFGYVLSSISPFFCGDVSQVTPFAEDRVPLERL